MIVQNIATNASEQDVSQTLESKFAGMSFYHKICSIEKSFFPILFPNLSASCEISHLYLKNINKTIFLRHKKMLSSF